MKRHDYGKRLVALGNALQDGNTTLGTLGRLADECGLGIYFKDIVCKEQKPKEKPWIRRNDITQKTWELAMKVIVIDKNAADYILSEQITVLKHSWQPNPISLCDCFSWSVSPQGYEYWDKINRKLHEKKG